MRYYSEATVNGIIHDMYQGNHIPKATDYPSIEIPESPWHTGMPTEEGLYVVLTKVTNKGIHSSEGTNILDWWDGYCFKNLKHMARHNPVFGNDVYSWVKWQKIEP